MMYASARLYRLSKAVNIVGSGIYEHLWVPPGYDFSTLGIAA